MFINVLLLIIGFAVIYYAGEFFIKGSVELAEIFGWSKLIIGVVILGFGTSAPEIAVSISSTLQNQAGIVTGNILGSNIANVLLILGLSLAIKPAVSKFKIAPIYLWLIIISSILFLLGIGLEAFSRWLGLCMLLLAIVGCYLMIRLESNNQEVEKSQRQHRLGITLLKIVFGLLFLIISAELIVDSVIKISEAIGISETIISATVVAIGTSLPELVLSVIAARDNHFDLVLGNIIGSNVSNVLLGIGVACTVIPIQLAGQISWFQISFFIVSTILLLIFCVLYQARNRYMGILALLSYGFFISYLLIK